MLFKSGIVILLSAVVYGSVLNFEDLSINNEINKNCGSFHLNAPYHGFLITSPEAPGATVYNATQTPWCRQSSSGAGPLHLFKPISKPNVLQGYGSELKFTAVEGKFRVERLGWASHPRYDLRKIDPNAAVVAVFTGRNAKGRVVRTERRVFTDTIPGPFVVELKGFKGLKSLEIRNEWKYTQDNVLKTEGAAIFVDDLVYRF
ncbi:hypothetical protein BZA77DRAFT_301035 [Pyronema omphalodes]|nr:hypothetical protein BZA77DRAFT_301035 [Pyronema omphalodes]